MIILGKRKRNQNVKTPEGLYNQLDKIFQFNFDPCPFKSKTDNLDADVPWGTSNFVNPPYENITPWVERAIAETRKGNRSVMLIPFRADTALWHDLIFPHAARLLCLRGRLKFKGYKKGHPEPMAVVVFDQMLHQPHHRFVETEGYIFYEMLL